MKTGAFSLAFSLLLPAVAWAHGVHDGAAHWPHAVQVAQAAPAALPSLGDAGEMTPLQERKLGDRIAREMFRDPSFFDDPVLT